MKVLDYGYVVSSKGRKLSDHTKEKDKMRDFQLERTSLATYRMFKPYLAELRRVKMLINGCPGTIHRLKSALC